MDERATDCCNTSCSVPMRPHCSMKMDCEHYTATDVLESTETGMSNFVKNIPVPEPDVLGAFALIYPDIVKESDNV